MRQPLNTAQISWEMNLLSHCTPPAMPLGCKWHGGLFLTWQCMRWSFLGFLYGAACIPLPLPLPRAATSLHLPLSPQMKFEFIPRHLDITESFWVFTIPEQCVSVPFLLVGNTTDPLVTLDRSHLNFHLLLVGELHGCTLYTQMCTAPVFLLQHAPKRKLEMGSGTGVSRSASSWTRVYEGEEGEGRKMWVFGA